MLTTLLSFQKKTQLVQLGNDATMHFWDAASRVLEGRVPEAIRDLQALLDNKMGVEDNGRIALPVALALIAGHKLSKVQ